MIFGKDSVYHYLPLLTFHSQKTMAAVKFDDSPLVAPIFSRKSTFFPSAAILHVVRPSSNSLFTTHLLVLPLFFGLLSFSILVLIARPPNYLFSSKSSRSFLYHKSLEKYEQSCLFF